jgi:hypothetical protein
MWTLVKSRHNRAITGGESPVYRSWESLCRWMLKPTLYSSGTDADASLDQTVGGEWFGPLKMPE